MATENMPLLGGPPALFTSAITTPSGTKIPQTIAHRGNKAAYPENSMGAFRAAVAVGSHAIETDLHLSKDGVVVLSHDVSLKRCFGVDKKVADCDWPYLSTLKTTREPHQGLARLSDLLEYLGQPERESIWVLLDIKLDDDAVELLTRIAKTIASVPTSRPWKERIVIGGWNEHYIDLSTKLLPGFPVAHIGVSVLYAKKFFRRPNVHFNLKQQSLVGPLGRRFMRAARRRNRSVFAWTVNDEHWMKWSICKGVDGVITDDPALFRRVCDDYADGNSLSTTTRARTVRLYSSALLLQGFLLTLSLVFWRQLNALGKKKKVASGKPLVSVKPRVDPQMA